MLDKLGIKYDLIDIIKEPQYLERCLISAPGLVIDEKLRVFQKRR